MDKYDIYADIAERTDGDIYIGVVGPVRTGKSTFIKRFMDLAVIPNIENENEKNRTRDELPQSANGKTVMTTEPKFIPKEAAKISLGDNVNLKVRMIDCVGFVVDGAEYDDGENARMVSTPWTNDPVEFSLAAEIGTKKVIDEHSTIGIVVTTDGSVTDIGRLNYEQAEERTINELKDTNKPFVVVLNTQKPYAPQTEELKTKMEAKYGCTVLPINCAQLKDEDISLIFESVLSEFPVAEIRLDVPEWFYALDNTHSLKESVIDSLRELCLKTEKLKSVKEDIAGIKNENIKKLYIESIDMGTGIVEGELKLLEELYYKALTETVNMPVESDSELISVLKDLAETKKKYDKYERAFLDADERGYGIVLPSRESISLEKPEAFKKGSTYGVRIKAKGETIHVIKTDVETSFEPVIGTEEQTKRFLENVLADFENDPEKLWSLNIFGRTLDNLINEGMYNKVYNMPDEAKLKLKATLQKILNEGNGTLICIIL